MQKNKFLKTNQLFPLYAAFYILLALTVATCSNKNQQIIDCSWQTHVVKELSFQYPPKFEKMDVDNFTEKLDDMSNISTFVHNKYDRLVAYHIYNVTGTPPTMQDALWGCVSAILTNRDATDVSYYLTSISDNTIGTKINYKLYSTEYTGFAFIYQNNTHLELLFFLPLTKAYSDEELERIITGIKVSRK